jgi:outer membrane protein assembly factor BamC
MHKYRLRALIAACAALALGACSSYNVDNVLPDKSVEYKREKQADRNLELPPDLTSDRINDRMSVPDVFGGVSTSYSEYATDRRLRGVGGSEPAPGTRGVLPDIDDIAVRRDGDEAWLVVNAPADDVWDRIVDFWQENGILMQEQDPTIGIMRTAWIENRANIGRDFVTNAIRRVFDGLYETSLRDQYRVRLERSDSGETEVFLTHFGMEEQIATVTDGSVERTLWVPRERDPGLEVEMLRRMMVYLGAADERARAALAAGGEREQPRSQLLRSGGTVELRIDETFGRAWRLVGLALDRVGFAVEDRDRSAGVYYVRYNDPTEDQQEEGWLSRLKFWGGDDDIDKVNRYQVSVRGSDDRTVVTVADEQGRADSSPTALRILTLLQEQIR